MQNGESLKCKPGICTHIHMYIYIYTGFVGTYLCKDSYTSQQYTYEASGNPNEGGIQAYIRIIWGIQGFRCDIQWLMKCPVSGLLHISAVRQRVDQVRHAPLVVGGLARM